MNSFPVNTPDTPAPAMGSATATLHVPDGSLHYLATPDSGRSVTTDPPAETARMAIQGVRADLHLCDAVVECGGQKFTPDNTKGYVEFHLSHSFPVVTYYGTALAPDTIQNSYRSMLHQVFNMGHLMRNYDRENIPRDRILGSIVGVEYTGGTRLPESRDTAPGIRAVAVFHKMAEGMDRILGQHQSGRKPWSVSMEVLYRVSESGFVLPSSDEPTPGAATPEAFARAGFEYVPAAAAPEELAACWIPEEGRIGQKYHGRPVALLMGGLGGSVHYQGVGLVEQGAEPTAEVNQFFAGRRETATARAIRNFSESVQNVVGHFENRLT